MWLLWILSLQLEPDGRCIAGCTPPRIIYHFWVSSVDAPETWQVRHIVQTKQQYYRVDRRKIAFIKFIFEAYDGIAALRTIEPQSGIILFYIAKGCELQFEAILEDLSKHIMIRPHPALSRNPSDQYQ
jgi:hypothetical protein